MTDSGQRNVNLSFFLSIFVVLFPLESLSSVHEVSFVVPFNGEGQIAIAYIAYTGRDCDRGLDWVWVFFVLFLS